jgi:Protein of unknown function (DUF2721)
MLMLQVAAQGGESPFAALSLIVAPAILTNACSVLVMSTSNRLARAVDLARDLGRDLDSVSADQPTPDSHRWLNEMSAANTRSVLLLRALRAIYTALGGFSSATLIALLGVVFEPRLPGASAALLEALAVVSGVIGVGGIVWAAVLLLRETRIAVTSLELRFSAQVARFPAVGGG